MHPSVKKNFLAKLQQNAINALKLVKENVEKPTKVEKAVKLEMSEETNLKKDNTLFYDKPTEIVVDKKNETISEVKTQEPKKDVVKAEVKAEVKASIPDVKIEKTSKKGKK